MAEVAGGGGKLRKQCDAGWTGARDADSMCWLSACVMALRKGQPSQVSGRGVALLGCR